MSRPSHQLFDLKGRRALVNGGSRGLGLLAVDGGVSAMIGG